VPATVKQRSVFETFIEGATLAVSAKQSADMRKISSDPTGSTYYEETFLRSTQIRWIARKNLPIHLIWGGSEEKIRLKRSYAAQFSSSGIGRKIVYLLCHLSIIKIFGLRLEVAIL